MTGGTALCVRRRTRVFMMAMLLLLLTTEQKLVVSAQTLQSADLQENHHHHDNQVYAFVSKKFRQAKHGFGRLVMQLRQQHQKNRQQNDARLRPPLRIHFPPQGQPNTEPTRNNLKSTATTTTTTCPCFTLATLQGTILSAHTTDHCVANELTDTYSWITQSSSTDAAEIKIFLQDGTCRVGGTAVPVSMSQHNLSGSAYRDCVQHFQAEFEDACYGLQTYRAPVYGDENDDDGLNIDDDSCNDGEEILI